MQEPRCQGGWRCPGTFNEGSGTPGECYACTGTTSVAASCNIDCTTSGGGSLAYTYCPEYQCTGLVPRDPNRCYYCVTPYCPVGECYDPASGKNNTGCAPCAVQCSVSSASATGPTSGQANVERLSGYMNGYTGVRWSLNGNSAGQTNLDGNGNSSTTFSSLSPNTTYRVKAEYFSADGSRQAVACDNGAETPFTTSPSTQTCTLNGKSGICGNGQKQTPGGGAISCGGTLEQGGSTSCTNPNYSICYVCSQKQVIPGCEASANVTESITANNASGAITVNPGQAVNINWRPLNVPSSGQVTNCSLSGALSGAVQPTGSRALNTQRSGTQNVFISCQYIDNNSTCNKSISNSSTVTVRADANECPGGIAACGNNNYGNLGACSGNWTYPGNNSWDNWCRQNSGSPQKTFCYQCNQTQQPPPAGQPSPTPPPVANPQGLFITGKLLIGKILADTFPPRYQIDAGDSLISELSATVQGVMNVLRDGSQCNRSGCFRVDKTQQATIGTNAVTGAYTPAGVPNVLRGSPIFVQSDSSCIPDRGGANCQGEQYAQKQRLEYDTPPNTMVSSNFVRKSYSCSNGCSGNYTKVEPVTPLGLIKTTVFTASGNNNSTSVSYGTGNTENGSCGNGCTLQSRVSYNLQDAPNPPSSVNGVCSGQDPTTCGGEPCNYSTSCFRYGSLQTETKRYPGCNGSGCTYTQTSCYANQNEYSTTPQGIVNNGCSGNTCYFQNYWTATYANPDYNYCSMKTFNASSYTVTPWSVTINAPPIQDIERTLSSLSQWRELFNWAGVESCYQNRPSTQWSVSPATAATFCSCSCDFPGDTSATSCSSESGYLTYSCKWPLKNQYRNFNLTPPGKYLLQIPINGARRINPINGTSQSVNVSDLSVSLVISGANLVEVNGIPVSSNSVTTKPSVGAIIALIDAPTTGSQISVSLQSTYNANLVEEVELGASNLYPLGWYEAEMPFGRTGTTGISDMKVSNAGSSYVNTIAVQNVTDGNRSFSCPQNQDPKLCSIPPGFTQVKSNLLNMINLLMVPRPPIPSWIQVIGGDVHSNQNIKVPGGP